ncbi:WD40-like Beta Propeller Repeat protein [Candidatus Bilamarchaeum dharawalense]|uniref:WD40-like Beta Propeller Repeat protein n=1 Tax=Candidatus Bilamarchaeum dharawalense TaxID=2885759 RepID=A0A5E4LMC2_9ARCH|nr:WD40-like Beta Propeller Repeat protein [Candidatus Bilamarchaeum dharawalense]
MKLYFLLSLILLFYGCTSPATKDRLDAIPSDAIKMTPQTDIYPPILHSSDWNEPIPLSSAINTPGGEDSPFITPDGNTLYFFFTPDVRIPVEKQVADGVTGIYVSKKVNGTWTKSERVVLQDSGKLALDGCEFVQDTTMWFCSAREGYTGINWFTAEMNKNGIWQNWKYAGDQFKPSYEVGELHINTGGDELYFHSSRAGGKGGLDLWVTKKSNGQWAEPENVLVVNTLDNEGWPFLSQDGNELWFLRFYQGSPAIFRSTKINGSWAEPELIISQFAGEPSLDNHGNLYFVHHFYNNNTMIEADIYVAYKK